MPGRALLLLAPALLLACTDAEPQKKHRKAPGEDFHYDDQVRILEPFNGASLQGAFTLKWEAGVDVVSMHLEADGTVVEAYTELPSTGGAFVVDLDEGHHALRLVGMDADGVELSQHQISVDVVGAPTWVSIVSPADGAIVPNPVRFAADASNGIDEIEILADDWTLGTLEPGGVLSYEFTGTGFERTIVARGYEDGELVATDEITITVEAGTEPSESSFNDLVMDLVDEYPTDGSYDYWWPSDSEWGGNPHDIYYQGELFSAGDPAHRSFCVGLTFEVFMRSFEEMDRTWGGDGSVNGIDFDELYEFRVDWYVRELLGMGIVDAMENYGIGTRVTDWDDVQAGDIIQFWRHSGSGHNAIFIDWETDSGGEITGFTYWSTQGSTDGIDYNVEYFGTSGSRVDPSYFFVGRVSEPDEWVPWH